jgi:TonB family protein
VRYTCGAVTYLGPSLRRTRPPSRPWSRATVALVASLLVNGAAFLWAMDSGIVGPLSAAGPRRSVVVAPLSARDWERNRSVDARQQPASRPPPVALAPPTPPPPPPPKTEEKEKLSGQIVDAAPSKDSTRPKDSKYLSDHDSTVAKETRSRHQRPGYENTLPKPASPDAGDKVTLLERDRAAKGGEAGREGVVKPGAPPRPSEQLAKPSLPGQEPRERLALKLDPHGAVRPQEARPGLPPVAATPGAEQPTSTPPSDLPEGEAGEQKVPGRAGPKALALMPTAKDYERIFGGPAPDKLDGVEEGEETWLNTRDFKYSSFYMRIHRAVQQQWDPSSPLRSRDPNGQRYSQKEWVTGVTVRLDEQGAVKQVVVVHPSGLEFLDNAAVQAFLKAQPFVNPPPALVDSRREIVLPMWTFHVDTRGPSISEFFKPSLPRRPDE